MASRRPKLGLSRKLVAYYLFFCLVAVCWLAASVIFTSHTLLGDRASSDCLSRLDSATAAVEMHWLRHGAGGLSHLLSDLANERRGLHAAVVGLDGKIIAHTDPSLNAQEAAEPTGSRAQIGKVSTLHYIDAQNRLVQEFRLPLASRGQRFGELRMAVAEPNLQATVQSAANLAPWVILLPLGLVGAGALVISQLARPIAQIEDQLRQIARQPLGAELDTPALRARDAATLGWNRIVEHLETLKRRSTQGGLESVLEQAAQARTDARFEEILERLSDGIAVTDATGRIEFANQAIAALLGDEADADDLGGALLEEKLLAAGADEKCDLLLPASRQRTAVCEVVQKTSDSERVLRVTRLPLGDGRSSSHVWSLRDVTQQRLAEQTRDRFIDTATHELRTPLSNIKAYAETLASAECIDFELQKEFCNIINSEVTRLARFIDDLLSISSMEVGALTVDRQKVETERMFEEVLSKVEPLMKKKGIEFEVVFPPRMPELTLDKDKILSVLVNVLGNAVKYTPAGGRVSLRVKAEDGAFRVAVQDSGVGIAPEEVAKVFDKFFRSDDPRVQAETGSGLGLSIAREVVRMHGGEIVAESELNKGSTFTVSLPLV